MEENLINMGDISVMSKKLDIDPQEALLSLYSNEPEELSWVAQTMACVLMRGGK